MSLIRSQRTIGHSVTVEGFGYWSGSDVRLEFRPAPVGAGISFVRDDLGPMARVRATPENRIEIPRRTCLRDGNVQVDMVEHVLATLAGLQIDNCEIGVTQAEMPGCDGSALAFVEALDSAAIDEQGVVVEQLEVTERIRLNYGESWIEAQPVEDESFHLDVTVDYPSDPVIGNQKISLAMTPDAFRREIAPCRTFLLEREALALVESGLGKRVTSQDLLVFGESGPIENQLRFTNECARHKALDVVGDLALAGYELVGRIVAYRSGHRLNAELARELVKRFRGAALKASA